MVHIKAYFPTIRPSNNKKDSKIDLSLRRRRPKSGSNDQDQDQDKIEPQHIHALRSVSWVDLFEFSSRASNLKGVKECKTMDMQRQTQGVVSANFSYS